MTEIPRFAIFYADGSIVEGGGPGDELVSVRVSRAWLEAPADGVLAVVCAQPATGRHVLCQKREFDGKVLRGGDSWFPVLVDGSHEFGHTDDLGPWARASGLIKFGLWVGTSTYERVIRVANEWGRANIAPIVKRPSVEVNGEPDGYNARIRE